MMQFNNGRDFGTDGEGWKDRDEDPRRPDPRQPGPECPMTQSEVREAIADTALEEFRSVLKNVTGKFIFDCFMFVLDPAPEVRAKICNALFDEAKRIVYAEYENGASDRTTRNAVLDAKKKAYREFGQLVNESLVSDEFLVPMLEQLRKRLKKVKKKKTAKKGPTVE